MSIDINNLGTNTPPRTGDANRVGGNEANAADVRQSTGKSSVGDTVSLSETAVKLGQLGVAVENQPVVDTKRVEQVRQAIMDGSYTVDPTRIAEKMMELDMALKPKA
jgi:negative regulator of flagellin synthesis FlgM